jgi:hypothetical protein
MKLTEPLLVALIALVLSWGFYSKQEALSVAAEAYVKEGRARLNSYAGLVQQRVQGSLEKLFEELDRNHDGVIDRVEFQTKSMAALATIRSLEMPNLEDLPFPPLPTLESGFMMFHRILSMQLMFLVGIAVVDITYSTFFNSKSHIHSDGSFRPQHVLRREALSYDTPMTWYERVKLVFFLASGLLFLRAILTFVFFFIAISCVNIAVLGGRSRTSHPHWFAFWNQVTTFFGYLMLASMGFYYIKIMGSPARKSEAKILIGNHVCVVEAVAFFLLCDLPSFVSRIENMAIPMFGGLVRATQAIVVDRSQSTSRTKTLDEIRHRAQNPHANRLFLFPEGTCDNHQVLFQFKKGAFEPGEPVQPVCFRFVYTHFNPAWTGRPCGGNDMLDLLLRLWSQFVNRLEVEFLPVHVPTEEERGDPYLYAANCQMEMAKALHMNVSDATFQDYVEAARKYYRRDKGVLAVGLSPSQTPGGTSDAEQTS